MYECLAQNVVLKTGCLWLYVEGVQVRFKEQRIWVKKGLVWFEKYYIIVEKLNKEC